MGANDVSNLGVPFNSGVLPFEPVRAHSWLSLNIIPHSHTKFTDIYLEVSLAQRLTCLQCCAFPC